MAKEKEGEHGKPKHEEGGGKKKKHLHEMHIRFAHDGSAAIEHDYKDKKEDDMPSKRGVFAGTASNLEDLQQHMEDHAGPVMNGDGGADEEEGEGEGEPEGGAPAPAAQGPAQ